MNHETAWNFSQNEEGTPRNAVNSAPDPSTNLAPRSNEEIGHNDSGSFEDQSASVDRLDGGSGNSQQIRYNYGTAANMLTIVQRGLDEIRLPGEYVANSVDYFVEPDSFENAVKTLRDHRILVLVADSDYGRHDAALNALSAVGGLAIREIRREPDESVRISEIPTRSRTGWILDLRQDEIVASSLGRSLASPETRQRLADWQSYLTVVLSRRLWGVCGLGGDRLQHYLERPSALGIVRRHLKDILPEEKVHSWLHNDKIRAWLADATPSDAVEWANRIREVEAAPKSALDLPEDLKKAATDEELFAVRVQTALDAASKWRNHLLDWYRRNETCQARDYLVSAALLEWRNSGDIFVATNRMSGALNGPQHKAAGQQGPGVLELTHRIEATLDGVYLKFNRPGYREAILDFVWADRPHLQKEILKWMCSEAQIAPDDAAISNRVATYVLRWTISTKDLRYLREVADAWSPHPKLRSRAVELFTAAALDSELGKRVRELLLEWSKPDTDVSADIRELTADICGGHLALIYKKMMLFRLGNLACIDDARVAQAARNKIASLWGNASLRGEIVSHVLQWLSSNDRTIEAGRSTFAVLMGISEKDVDTSALLSYLLANPEQLDVLARGLRVVLEHSPLEQDVVRSLWAWLNAAAKEVRTYQILERFMVAASAPRGPNDYDAQARIALVESTFLWAHNCAAEDQTVAERLSRDIAKVLMSRDPYSNMWEDNAPSFTHNPVNE